MDWIARHAATIKGPVLEVGSRQYQAGWDIRKIISARPYVGVDQLRGDGVDVVIDMSMPLAEIWETLGFGDGFNAVICLSVLEHCEDPFAMARNITALLLKGGLLFVSVPFAWRLHAYPKDFWRFTPDGIRTMFGHLDFVEDTGEVCSNVFGDADELDALDDRRIRHDDGPMRQFHYTLPPTLISMIGVKR